MPVCRFGQEHLGCVMRVDTRVFEQEPQVKQIPALQALHHATQLLPCYLWSVYARTAPVSGKSSNAATN